MQRLAVVAKLRPGVADEAEKLIALGPPFDPRKHGFERHMVYLSADTVVFVFEGGDPRKLLASLAAPDEKSVFSAWESLPEGTPRLAREAYSWISPADAVWHEGWGE